MTEVEGTSRRVLSRRGFLGTAAMAGLGLTGAGTLLAGCGSGSSGGPGGGASGGGGSVTWASWANPGEAERYKQVSSAYTKQYGVPVTWQQVVGDYQTKLLTQLAGGAAPDAFYVGDGQMAPMTASGKLEKLDDFLASADSPLNLDDIYPGLLTWCKSADGALYGVPVDCNPKVFWFNKGLLAEAGVTTDPAAAFAAGSWNRDALDDLLIKVKATGKRGLIIESGWFDMFAYVTAFGGKAWSEDGTKAVFDTDPKALEILGWMFDHFKAETISYGGSLPKGQGVDALFYGGQLASITYGRWILPNLKKLKNLQYDIAPLPSEDGKTIAPVPVACAAMSVQTGAKDKQAALMFFGRYVNADGQKARLAGGGNAVPSIKGLDDIVLEGGQPANAIIFNQIAAKGYAIPPAIARNAKVATNFNTTSDALIKGGASAEEFATKMAAYINSSGA
jgi:multiple sugar transport system substrate-binding protein